MLQNVKQSSNQSFAWFCIKMKLDRGYMKMVKELETRSDLNTDETTIRGCLGQVFWTYIRENIPLKTFRMLIPK